VSEGYSLSEAVYSFGYSLRLKYSSFQPNTLQWLLDNSSSLIAADTPSILSLGCGDGAFDIEIIEHLRKAKRQLQFSGLDFNATDLAHFRHLLSTRDKALQDNVTLHHMKYDASSHLGDRYDFIYMVHFLQSFEDVLPVIRNTLEHLRQDGRLLIIQQKRQGIYELKQRFRDTLTNQKFHSSEEIKESLREENITFSSHNIDTYFDISVMGRMSLDALLLMSFCFTNDLAVLDTRQQEEIRKAFLAYATVGENGVPVIYEPMEAIVCQA
jgi:SAM-dependent methyltransferase